MIETTTNLPCSLIYINKDNRQSHIIVIKDLGQS